MRVGGAAALLCSVCVLAAAVFTVRAVSLDIHVVLSPAAEQRAVYLDSLIHAAAPGDAVHLKTTDQPHITLYLTDFLDADESVLLESVADAVKLMSPQCVLSLHDFVVEGAYGMWSVTLPPCLQLMSDVVVNATSTFCNHSQPLPPWVLDLPEPERSEKIAMFKLYCSPNVFAQFQPHVTLAYDDDPADKLQAVFAALPNTEVLFSVPAVAVSLSGPYGTVLRDQQIAYFALQ